MLNGGRGPHQQAHNSAIYSAEKEIEPALDPARGANKPAQRLGFYFNPSSSARFAGLPDLDFFFVFDLFLVEPPNPAGIAGIPLA